MLLPYMGMVAILIDKTICINFQTPFNRRLHMKLKKLALEFQSKVWTDECQMITILNSST